MDTASFCKTPNGQFETALNATASAPAALRIGHDGSFMARHTAATTSCLRRVQYEDAGTVDEDVDRPRVRQRLTHACRIGDIEREHARAFGMQLGCPPARYAQTQTVAG